MGVCLPGERGARVLCVACDVEVARDRYVHRIEGTVACLALSLEQGDPLADRLGGGELVEQQVGTERGGITNRLGPTGGDPHRWMRLLGSGRLYDDLMVMPEPTPRGRRVRRSSTPSGSPPETPRSAPLPPRSARRSQ